MNRTNLNESIYKLFKRTATELPPDISFAIEEACGRETAGSIARETLEIVRKSSDLSSQARLPICQDTGTPFLVVKGRPDFQALEINEAVLTALRQLSKEGILRQNCVETLSGRNTGDNTGPYVPQIHYLPWDGPLQLHAMFKGGGSENVSSQYSLPDSAIKAGRDLEGVRRCILAAVHRAQGKGCAPGILGVCIGGDRASGYLLAKEQLFRKLDDVNPNPELAALEKQLVDEANTLGIGPMGLGGATTLLGVKIGCAGRHPASYFVTISYSCWATRRYSIQIDKKGDIEKWL